MAHRPAGREGGPVASSIVSDIPASRITAATSLPSDRESETLHTKIRMYLDGFVKTEN